MNRDIIPPSDRGRRLLPIVIDQLATSDPSRTFVSITITNNIQDGFRDISFGVFARAINRCAWWMEKALGRCDTFETLNYVGPQDLRYLVLLFAAIKTGYKLFFSSPLNSAEGHIALLESLQCEVMLVSENLSPTTEVVLSRRNMRTLLVHSLEYYLESGIVPVYPYTKTFEEAKYQPFVVLHTSGSTGFPKPVILTHGTVAQHDTFMLPAAPGDKPIAISLLKNKRVFIGLGLFHSAAMGFITFAIYSNTQPVLPPPVPMTAEVANLVHLHGNLDASFHSPATLIAITKNPEYLENIKRLRYLSFGGGPLPKTIGNILKTHTHLFVSFGATETGIGALRLTDPDDWEYMSFDPRMGVELRPYTEDLYELYFVRKPELKLSQGIFSTFPSLDQYTTKDLFSKHPTKAEHWLFEGRSDDVIVCSTGQKINPLTMESLVNGHPSVVSSIVCGHGRVQISLLVEAKQVPRDDREKQVLVREIWPTIEKGNYSAQSHGRITQGLILFTESEKPMVRAGKGTILRKLTEDLYRKELDDLYWDFKDKPF